MEGRESIPDCSILQGARVYDLYRPRCGYDIQGKGQNGIDKAILSLAYKENTEGNRNSCIQLNGVVTPIGDNQADRSLGCSFPGPAALFNQLELTTSVQTVESLTLDHTTTQQQQH